MDEYISREALVKKIRSNIFSFAEDSWESGYNKAMAEIMEWIKRTPAADVEPVRHGRWIRGVSKGFPKNPTCLWYCSCCGEKIRYNDTLRTYQKSKKPVNEVNPRCRKCGAKMDGDEEK